MSIAYRSTLLILLSSAAMAVAPVAATSAASITGSEFLAQCDRIDPNCRSDFVAGLQAVYEGHLACPPRIDLNTPISPWIAYMHRRLSEKPSLAGADKNRLQLEAFMHLWPCPKKK